MMNLYVWNEDFSKTIPADIAPAAPEDLKNTLGWQTQWTTQAAQAMPNKVALRRRDNGELLGLMSYQIDRKGYAVKIVYMESAGHSNAKLLRQTARPKKYVGIARAMFAYAIQISIELGFDGVLYFRAKTSELREYYGKEFGAVPLGQYDPFRMIIWEDAAQAILASYENEVD